MPSCASCHGFQAASFPQDAHPDMFKPGTKELSATSAQLISTRDGGCESCYMILEAIHRCGRDVSAACEEPWDINSPFKIQLRVLERDIWLVEAIWDITNKQFFGGKPTIEVELYAESRESSPFAHLGLAQVTPLRLGPDECAGIFKAWMSECRDHHECPKPEEAILPKRVIDVRGFTQNESVALLETPSGQRGHYIALSHCWGSESFIQTTRATLEQRKTRIDWSDLPRNFKDAITFARRMELQYIWIDSLCIIQDDKLDWEMESAVMANIYSDAYITLAAAGATGSSCFFERWTNPSMMNWTLRVPIYSHQIRSLENPNLKICARMRLDGTFNLFTAGVTISILRDSAPLLSRGWVFQERYLSPRVLYFHPSSMVWECRSAMYLEPYLLEDFCAQRTQSDVPLRLKNLWGKLASPSTTSLAEAHDLWLSLVTEYTRLLLTYESDQLPALSGVATRFREFMALKGISDEKYLAGIWRSDLVRSLAWGIGQGETRRCSKPCPPSWSWASLERVGRKSTLSFRHDRIRHAGGEQEREFVPSARLRVLDVNCELAGTNPFGHVSAGLLRLVADTVDAVIYYEQKLSHRLYYKIEAVPVSAVLLFQSDVDDDWVLVETEILWKDIPMHVEGGDYFITPGTVVKCLLLGRANEYGGAVNFAIVLNAAGGQNLGSYERIGLLVCKIEKVKALLAGKESEISVV